MRKTSLWIVCCSILLSACQQVPYLDRIKKRGELLVATINSPSTYYQGAKGPTGLEYDLVTLFAEELGIQAKFVFYDSTAAVLQAVLEGDVHMAAAGLTVTRERAKNLLVSTPYQSIQQQLIYRRGSRRPKNLNDLGQEVLHVPVNTGFAEELSLDPHKYPELNWLQVQDRSTSDLLHQLNKGDIAFTVANSNQFALSEHYFPYAKAAFNLGGTEYLSWGFSRAVDSSLKDAADKFIWEQKQTDRLSRLQEKYFDTPRGLGFVDKRDFWRHVDSRLPKYEQWFREAAEETGIDWRMLAAIAYQESHWNPNAVSPTGVRGIMMLTRAARKQLKIRNGNDPRESILGGARYVKWKEKKLPERIQGDDRLWLTLASYNIGFGHLEDARILTQRMGGNPDSWEDVKRHLPLLTKKKYYSTVKNGYARGREPVTYIENIQQYYNLLIWHSNQI